MCEQCEKLQARIEQLESYLEKTADGVVIQECDVLYCPKCNQVIPDYNQDHWLAYCWNCENRDTGDIPLPLLYGSCLSKPRPV